MPQMNRGGKFVFGESIIRGDGMELLKPEPGMRLLSREEQQYCLYHGCKRRTA